ncbi:uracil phosphoribosyltransferase-domain-containing protein [Syncephalastrum racemosum]|uniref:uracil phosphoribosyltransferase n=1 Tax=Syncephalastrum racemosum TaxID=13706 RepID=A0A1X2HA19_SYNRA|nr:uracil phosphoribosyltransferase-domain-containing protein [Syncephalastrum racemosum]
MTPTLHPSTHPLVAIKLSQLRDAGNGPKVVRELVHDLSGMLAYEASADMTVVNDNTSMTPYGPYNTTELKERVALVPVLRSGLGLVDGFLNLFPDAHVHHLGLYREKASLLPVEYYNKLPSNPNVDTCFVLDPMVATGNTAVSAINTVKEWGMPGDKIKFVAVLGSEPGLKRVAEEHPDVHIYVAGIDNELDKKGYIRPGLGDSGDRLFNTF